MIAEISQKVYEILKDDPTLSGLLPNVKDGTNIWEMRVPNPANTANFPVVVYRVVSGAPLLNELSLNAFNWFIEVDIVGNTSSSTQLWTIYERIYQLLQDRNVSSGNSIAYRCQLDFFNTDYDQNTLNRFILTRWQIFSVEIPTTKLGDLS